MSVENILMSILINDYQVTLNLESSKKHVYFQFPEIFLPESILGSSNF